MCVEDPWTRRLGGEYGMWKVEVHRAGKSKGGMENGHYGDYTTIKKIGARDPKLLGCLVVFGDMLCYRNRSFTLEAKEWNYSSLGVMVG